ncbi:hypothetical protein HYV21_00070 [Candidatus Microgenomates bacterium]|nr:hypothetical protein [Candidatus Microgenomates bacterium]
MKFNKRILLFLVFSSLIIVGFLLGTNYNSLQNFSFPETFRIKIAENISPRQLDKELKDKNFTFVNVHTPYEGEIKGTDMFITHDEMIANKAQLPNDKNAPIILYCKTGRMSADALATLRGMGYTNVRHLEGGMDAWKRAGYEVLDLSRLPEEVLPKEGMVLPVKWGQIGPRLVEAGVIDLDKFNNNLTDEQKKILTQSSSEFIKIDSSNSHFVVNMLWALGLAQKSIVYEEGPMGKEHKAGVGNFASTGGWTLGREDAVRYLNQYELVPLTAEQQQKVAEIAKNVYRPCCGNSTWFPDCNHGMAALSAIELMVAEGVPEEQIYKYILALNSYWFPDTYIVTATYFARQGIQWKDVDAKLVLGKDFSSAQGAREVAKKVGPLLYRAERSGSCGA